MINENDYPKNYDDIDQTALRNVLRNLNFYYKVPRSIYTEKSVMECLNWGRKHNVKFEYNWTNCPHNWMVATYDDAVDEIAARLDDKE